MSSSGGRVALRVSKQKAYVWDVDDISTLRAKHHICGVLTGTLPHLSQQNVFLGIPLVLMPEEVVLLVEKELAVLVDDPIAHQAPNEQAIRHWNDARVKDVHAQQTEAAAKEAKAKESVGGRAMSQEALLKRREREERRAAAAQLKALAEGEDQGEGSTAPVALTPAPEKMSTASAQAYSVTVEASSDGYEWYSPEGATYDTIASAKKAGIWIYPGNLHERAKCGVFRDLWEKGCFMGGGIKFGGDFLVYPGDPLRYHSHFTATVIDTPTSAMRPMEIVAHGRLGTATKKAHLLCGWDDEKQEVSHLSIEWAGFG